MSRPCGAKKPGFETVSPSLAVTPRRVAAAISALATVGSAGYVGRILP
jgi:hypothetical protein